MKRAIEVSVPTAAVLGLFLLAAPAQAGQMPGKTLGAWVPDPLLIQVASHMESQTANIPVGTIRLRVIPEVGGQALREPIRWRVMTYGKDDSGKRHQVAEANEATPEIVLPAGWYVVHAEMKGKTIKHPVEVTAGKTFKYTLVKQ